MLSIKGLQFDVTRNGPCVTWKSQSGHRKKLGDAKRARP